MMAAHGTLSQLTEADPVLAELVEEITNKIQAGESIDLSTYEREHPEYVEQLHKLLPAIEVLAELGNPSATQTSSARQGEKSFCLQQGELHTLNQGSIVSEQCNQGQERYDGNVLHQENRKSRTSGGSSQLTAFGQYLQTKSRRRQRQAKSDNHSRLARHIQQQRQPGKHQAGHYHLGGTEAKHQTPHHPQACRLEFDADKKQQQYNTNFREMPDFADIVD